MRVTPLYVEIALHYYYSLEEFPRLQAPACKAAVEDMADRGLLVRRTQEGHCGAMYERTDALEVWVSAICSAPFPVHHWVIPDKVG